MKKILLLFILCVPLLVGAQMNLNFGIGYDAQHSVPTSNLGVEYQGKHRHFVIGTEMRVSVTRMANANNFFGFKVGYKAFNFVTLRVGEYYNLISSDYKRMNHWTEAYSIAIGGYFTEKTDIEFEMMYIDKTIQPAVTFKYLFD